MNPRWVLGSEGISNICRACLSKLLLIQCVVVISACFANTSYAEKAKWELGIGLGVLDIPFYPGSSQSKTYVLPIPHISYLSENLEIDNGVDATFLRSPRLRLNLSADLGVPVNSSESDVRDGMPDLDLVIQVGPTLEITLAGGRFKPGHTRLELPLRAAIATDLNSAEHVGWVLEPRLTYESRRPHKTGFAHLISGGFRTATEKYHQYYYNVEPAFETSVRRQFNSGNGYSGLFLDYIANWRTESMVYWMLFRYQNLNGAVYENSPLVEEKDYFLLGAGLSWVFAKN